MKSTVSIARNFAGASIALALGLRVLDGGALAAAETSAVRIGVYDSRVVAYAFFWSDAETRRREALVAAAKAARAVADEPRCRAAESAIKAAVERSHLQVFSTAPADDALAAIDARLPAIMRAAGVARLVSKWDEPALRTLADAERVDVTDLLVREFRLGEKQLEVIADLRRHEPLPLARAREMIDAGTL